MFPEPPPPRRPRPRRLRAHPRPLTEAQILDWADRHRERHGRWPANGSGPVADALSENWQALDMALRNGSWELPGGSSLAQLLAAHRGARNKKRLPLLDVSQLLALADAHFARTGQWPTRKSGRIPEAPGETWAAVDAALNKGCRGFPGDTSLARFLARFRGVRNRKALPELTESQILDWAKAHRRRTGRWPREKTGPVTDAPGETRAGGVNAALREGLRKLPAGASLHRLLHERDG